ncbi:DUF2599 domain-containing protein [Paenarthrobacter ureafaciens]|uniref:DUF2599 domain-containing protein n=1 Tax=Paenarthrobacter ureafaciens TaxID=37931 RepID=UPI001F38B174|nr:DUF2599 domain-containing protein [Paenarthrobacter ureafaciens]UOD83135.1 DUF2599 domain-containing protein [Paenarthrobacter ureafaciens]WNZ05955.1 DUF2599 domain-containing protein [Paenarthrobacter ureafaciens]
MVLLAGIAPAHAEKAPEESSLSAVAPETLQGTILAAELSRNDTGKLEKDLGAQSVIVPDNTGQPATITADETSLDIYLPSPEKRAESIVGENGQVQFNNRDDSLTNILPKTDGSLQIATTILSADAPTTYEYALDLLPGSTLRTLESGTVEILDADGKFLAGVGAPWAKDASGKEIATHYEIVGSSLVQVVDHTKASNVLYPVVADPWFGIDLYYQPGVQFVSQGYKINVYPTSWGTTYRYIDTWWAHRDEIVSKLGSQGWRWNNSIQEQLYCHIAGWPASAPEYNLESWRPTINWAESLTRYQCNPYDGKWS